MKILQKDWIVKDHFFFSGIPSEEFQNFLKILNPQHLLQKKRRADCIRKLSLHKYFCICFRRGFFFLTRVFSSVFNHPTQNFSHQNIASCRRFFCGIFSIKNATEKKESATYEQLASLNCSQLIMCTITTCLLSPRSLRSFPSSLFSVIATQY